jgi:sphingosine kinase
MVVEQDKHKMVDALQSRRTRDESILTPNAKLNGNAIDPPLLKHSTDDEGWITFDKPLLYVYAGQGPYVARFVGLPIPSISQSEGCNIFQ